MLYSNVPPKDLTQTEEYFSNYFAQRGYVNPATYEALIAHFEKQTNNKDVARIIVGALIQTSIEKNVSVTGLIDKFANMSVRDVEKFVVSYLNYSRKNSSFLGFTNTVKNSNYVKRTVLP